MLEVNPRASRTVPYVSKATGVPLAKIAARLMAGRKLREFLPDNVERGTPISTPAAVTTSSRRSFPGRKFPGVDTVLGPEMKSTGEVMGVADNFGEAFAKAQLAAGQMLPAQRHGVHQRHRPRQAARVPTSRRRFVDLGFKLVATHGTADVLEKPACTSSASTR